MVTALCHFVLCFAEVNLTDRIWTVAIYLHDRVLSGNHETVRPSRLLFAPGMPGHPCTPSLTAANAAAPTAGGMFGLSVLAAPHKGVQLFGRPILRCPEAVCHLAGRRTNLAKGPTPCACTRDRSQHCGKVSPSGAIGLYGRDRYLFTLDLLSSILTPHRKILHSSRYGGPLCHLDFDSLLHAP